MTMIYRLLILSSAILAGCASGPGYDEYTSQIRAPDAGWGRIYFYRLAIVGAAVQPKVRIDGEPVGKATPKGFFYVDRPPGEYEISATTEVKRKLTLALEAGQQRYVRLEMKIGVFAGHVKPVLVDDDVGKAQIQKTKYIRDDT